jgi:putative methionine-R-sulfoxide reductase with GAF domain
MSDDHAPDPTALAAIDAVLATDADADDILRGVVAALVTEGHCVWAGILFSEDGELVLGPEAGTPNPSARTQLPITYKSDRVAELVADGADDPNLLKHVAERVSEYCLVGWDTGGAPWSTTS